MAPFATSLDLLRRRRWWLSSVLGVLAGLVMFARAQAPTDFGMATFLKMVPLGAESKGAVIPSFDVTGRRSSLIIADVIRRIDDGRLYAEKLVVQTFNEDPAKDVRIDLNTAFYHMAEGGILRSTERSRVSRPDFEIEGDNLIYDTSKNQGRMAGNIRMVIFDTSNLSSEGNAPPQPKPAKK
jgi:hypothetical protein